MKGIVIESNITELLIDLELIQNLGLNINEYLILYNIANNNEINHLFKYKLEEITSLEKRGFLKITTGGVYLRAKADPLFAIVSKDQFTIWLESYPIKVTTRLGRSRALSPANEKTILGKTLRKKWDLAFKKDIIAQKKAVKVLQLQVADMERSGELEYMVEARRWLNEGFYEKYEHLIDEKKSRDEYKNEDWY